MQTTHYNGISIIQSLPQNESPTGARLCEDISALIDAYALDLDLKLYNIESKDNFISLLFKLTNEARTVNLSPILHIEAHGSELGLEFSSGDFITWAEMKAPLTELNVQTKNNLFITLAACKGAYLIDVLRLTDRAPCCGLAGPKIDIHICDLVGFYSFYKELLTTGNGDEAIKLLMESSPNSYYITTAEMHFAKVFRKYLAECCTKQEIKKRALRIHEDSKKILNQKNTPNKMNIFKRQLANTEGAFRKYKKKFLMIDLYPENKKRFTLEYTDLTK